LKALPKIRLMIEHSDRS